MDSLPRRASDDGLCECGCGRATPIATRTRNGNVKGEHVRFVNGSHSRWARREPIHEDRGYKTPCLIWQKSKIHGYGQMHTPEGPVSAHRRYYEEAHGPIPDGREVDHLCCQTDCVELSHLEAVTPTMNKRRQRNTQLTFDQAVEIRQLAKGRTDPALRLARELAPQFGVSIGVVREVLRGRSWKDAVPA